MLGGQQTPVLFDTVAYNVGGGTYNPATGVYTAPVAGYWFITGRITVNATDALTVNVGADITNHGPAGLNISRISNILYTGTGRATIAFSEYAFFTAANSTIDVKIATDISAGFNMPYQLLGGSAATCMSIVYLGS
jgi:hypothetical protein